MGMKVAAVAVGGVVIGTLTLGIGLIPYMTVVGITAVASGAGVGAKICIPITFILISLNLIFIL